MKKTKIVSYVKITVAILLIMSFIQMPIGHSVAFDANDRTLAFTSDVLNIDLSKYNVTLLWDRPPPNDAAREQVSYSLENNNSSLQVVCTFSNGTIVWANLFVHKGSPIYLKAQSSSLAEQAATFIEKYAAFTGFSHLQAMRNSLTVVSPSVTAGTYQIENIKLVVQSEGSATLFTWANIYNGIDGPKFAIGFSNGVFQSLNDQQSQFTMGNSVVSVTEKQAISIASDHAETFSWTVNSVPITDFTILGDPVQTKLILQPRENSTLYPYWIVDLYLDKTYAGGINYIEVGVWADTGKIAQIQALGYGGGVPIPSTTATPTASPTQIPEFPANTVLLAITMAAAVGIATVAVIKKRRK